VHPSIIIDTLLLAFIIAEYTKQAQKDNRREVDMHVWPFYLVYILPVSALVGGLMGGANNYLAPLIVFVLIPVIDQIIGKNTWNPPKEIEPSLENNISYRIPLYIAAPIQLSLMIWGAWMVTSTNLPMFDIIGLTISIGLSGGVIGINIAHELVHRPSRQEQFLGRLLLWSVCYLHWGIEHVAGHHRHVATPKDAATAKLGQNFYSFWPQTVIGAFKGAWNIEAAKLKRKNKSVLSAHNKILQYIIATIILVLFLAWSFGIWAVVYYFGQSIVAFSLLEIVNYVEHYGLLRRQDEFGKYEKVTPIHSWNSSHRLTNYFLFNLQRHSDHHANPMRRYTILRHMEKAPQFPCGYAGLILLALVPPLWFKIIDPKVPSSMKDLAKQEQDELLDFS